MAHPAAALDRALAALGEPTRRGVVVLLHGEARKAGELARGPGGATAPPGRPKDRGRIRFRG